MRQEKFTVLEGGPPTHCNCGKPLKLMPMWPDWGGGELYCPECQPDTAKKHAARLKRWAKRKVAHSHV